MYAWQSYSSSGGRHFARRYPLIEKVIASQIGYVDRWQKSGFPPEPVRAAMYAREVHHLATVVGQQQAMKERGAQEWRRVLHPELSKTGPCPQCVEDAKLTHPIDMPFFDHPNGVCSMQTLVFSGTGGTIELPVPGKGSLSELAQRVASLLGKSVQEIIRRIRR